MNNDTSNTNGKVNREIFTGEPRHELKLLRGPADAGSESGWMLFDPFSDSYYRLTDSKKQIIAALDRNYPLNEFMQKLKNAGIIAKENEVIDTIKFLQANMLLIPTYGSVENAYRQKLSMEHKTRLQRLTSTITYLRFPPIHPERFFAATSGFVKALFNRYFLATVFFLSICGYLALTRNWNYAASMLINSLSWSGMAKYTLAIIFIKIIHECAHAYLAAVNGIRVRSIGISIVFFLPRVFTDLTDAWRLPRKKRLQIDAAGIVSEIIIGGIAALIWAVVPPGTLHSTMFFIFSTTVINTILVNGNPFIRFDGYYILMDITGIDNLMTRSNLLVRNWWRHHIFGIFQGNNEELNPAKKYFLLFFGIGAYIYRLFLYTTIVLILYNKFTKPLALVLLALEVWTLLLLPFYREIKFIAHMRKQVKNYRVVGFVAGLVLLVGVFCIPLPWEMSIPCELRAEKSGLLTVPEGGFIKNQLASKEFKVKQGELITALSAPSLDAKIERARLDSLRLREELEQFRSESKLLPLTRKKHEELKAATVLLRELKVRRKQLNIHAPQTGIFVSTAKDIKPGRWLAKGDVLGEILSGNAEFYAYLPADQVRKLQVNDRVSILLQGELKHLQGKVNSINPLPAKLRLTPLIQGFGGSIPCHYSKEQNRFIPNIPHYRITITMDGGNSYKGAYGRIGSAHIRKYTSIAGSTLRYALKILQRELSF